MQEEINNWNKMIEELKELTNEEIIEVNGGESLFVKITCGIGWIVGETVEYLERIEVGEIKRY